MSNLTGIYAAVVRDLSDPTGQGRARLAIPSVFANGTSGWARPVLGKESVSGARVGDNVWVLFEQGSIMKPTWFGPVKATIDWTNVANKPLFFPPSAHSHLAGDVTGGVFNIARLPVGVTAGTVAAGDDPRFGSGITGAAGGDLTGTYPNPTIANGVVTDAKVATANKDGAAATASMRTLGTGAQQAAAGNDARLSDARTPLAHTHTKAQITDFAHTHLIADLPVAASGTSSTTQVVRADDSRLSDARTPLTHTHTKSQITDFAHTHVIADLPVATSGTSSSTQVVRADDSRLSDARTPTAHTHTKSQITDFAHTHVKADITDFAHTHTLTDIASGGTLTSPLVQTKLSSTPSSTPSGALGLYPKTDGKYYYIDNTGLERPLIPVPNQLHLNASFDAVAASTVGPASTTVTSRLMPTNWTWDMVLGSVSKPPYASLVADDTQTVFGVGYSLKVTLPNENHEQDIDSSVFNVVPGSLVTQTLWTRTSGTGPGVYISIMTSATSNPNFFVSGTVNYDSANILPGTTWQKLTVSTVVPAGHTYCRMKIRVFSDSTTAANAGDIWVDETETSMQITPPAQVITGEIKMWPTSTAPAGYFLCDGGTFDGSIYPALATLVGDQFGTHSGSTYYLPDFRGRMPLGIGTASPAVNGGTAHTLGQKGGEETHLLTVAESGLKDHTHLLPLAASGAPAGTSDTGLRASGTPDSNFRTGFAATGTAYGGTHYSGVGSNASSAHNVLNPFLGINFIIKN